MISFIECSTNDEKNLVLEFLKIKSLFLWNSKNFDKYWHTARFLQSIIHKVICKRMFVDDKQNIKVIIVHFATNKPRENYEIWVDELLSIEELNLISNALVKLANKGINENKLVLFRILTQNLAESLQKQSIRYEEKFKFTQFSFDTYYLIDSLDSFNIQSIKGFEFRNIPIEFVEVIISNWKYGTIEDKEWMTNSIKNYPSLGVWDLTKEKMIGYFMYMNSGTCGTLYIDSNYRGLGLGKMLVCELTKRMKDKGLEVFIEIDSENISSKYLFEKLKYVKVSKSIYGVCEIVKN